MLLALDKPFCMHALLACCGAEIPTQDQKPRELARLHYTEAVKALRKNLNESNIQSQWIVTTLTVMMLCIYERSKAHGSSGVEIHLSGAARMIQLCARTKSNAFNLSDTEHAMYRLVQESFIFHVATSLPFQQGHLDQVEIETALQLAEDAAHSHFQPEDSFYANSPVLGFPPQLFRCIYMTYRLYKDSLSKRVDKTLCQSLDRDLERWSDHIAKLASGSCEGSDRELENRSSSIMPISSKGKHLQMSSYAFLGQRLYVSGCRILLHRMSPAEGMSESAFEALMSGAIEDLRLLQPGSDYFAEYYCWPLLTIGMNLEHRADREMLMSQVRAFWVATNNGTMRRLADILDVYWKSIQNV
ncbi:C6 zinc finger domain protein [Penicillium malachiteum]|nr:C6 zinc finger domain protein [Penicillium malachiteum]